MTEPTDYKKTDRGDDDRASTFRKSYRKLNESETELVNNIKTAATTLDMLLDDVEGRYGSLAKTSLEQAVMWAVKGVTQ